MRLGRVEIKLLVVGRSMHRPDPPALKVRGVVYARNLVRVLAPGDFPAKQRSMCTLITGEGLPD